MRLLPRVVGLDENTACLGGNRGGAAGIHRETGPCCCWDSLVEEAVDDGMELLLDANMAGLVGGPVTRETCGLPLL